MKTLSSVLTDTKVYLNTKNYLWFQSNGVTKVRKVYSQAGTSFVVINKAKHEIDTNNLEVLSTVGVIAPYFN